MLHKIRENFPEQGQKILATAITLVVISAAWLVFKDRWIQNRFYNVNFHWEKIQDAVVIPLPGYFSKIFVRAGILVLLGWLAVYLGRTTAGFKTIPEFIPTPKVIPQKQKKIGLSLLGSGLGLSTLSLILNHQPDRWPGLEYAAALLAFIMGGFVLTYSLAPIHQWLRAHGLFAGLTLLAHFGFVAFLNAIYSNHLPALATGIICGSIWAYYIFRYHSRIPAIFYLIHLTLAISTIYINGWWFSVIGDEYSFYRVAVILIKEPNLIHERLFRGDFVYGQQTYLSSIIMAIPMKILGISNFSWRFSNLYLSALSLGLLYPFFRFLFNRKLAWLITILLATSHYLMAFGKIGYNNLQAFFALALVLWSATWVIQKKHFFSLVTAGAALGFCFYAFPAALFAVPLPFLLLLYCDPPKTRPARIRWIWISATALLCALPLFLQPEYMVRKLSGTLIRNTELLEQVGGPLQYLSRNLIQSIFSPVFIPHESHFVVSGYTDPLTGMLSLAGLGLTIWLIRKNKGASFFSVSFLYMLVLVGISHGNLHPPNTRMFMLLPWVIGFAGIGLWTIFDLFQLNRPEKQFEFNFWLGCGLIFIIWANLHQTYPLSFERSAGYHSTQVLFLNTMEQAGPNHPDILFIDNVDIDVLQSMLDQLKIYDTPHSPARIQQLTDDQLTRASFPEQFAEFPVVMISPWVAEDKILLATELLQNAGREHCYAYRSDLENIFPIWYVPEYAWVCPDSRIR